MFGMTAGILLFEVVLFSIFGKADIQVGCIINVKIHLEFPLRPGTTLKEAKLKIELPTVFWSFVRELVFYLDEQFDVNRMDVLKFWASQYLVMCVQYKYVN